MTVRWSLKYTAGVNKFTVLGILCIIVSAVAMVHTTIGFLGNKKGIEQSPAGDRLKAPPEE